ncbi:MAG: diguanylate cyclase [Clostridia bacterium]|nr:diguanylate cyclase [Clostridia bacterium]
MNRISKNLISFQIQNEYNMIDDKWLNRHYRTLVGLTVFSFLFELTVAAALFLGDSIEMIFTQYALKYIIAPIGANMVLVITATFVMRLSSIKQRTKVYFISLLSVGVCFIFYTVHIIFNSLYLIFFIPILFTVIYNDFLLTTATAVTSIGARIISELFIVWDPDKINILESRLGITNFIISTFILLLLYFITIVVIRFEKEKNAVIIKKEIDYRETQQKLIIDELTNVYNRTALRNAFQKITDDTSDDDYTFALIDLDNFKLFNDEFGHQFGDLCLAQFGHILKKHSPNGVLPFRYGGDEFCLLFKNFDMSQIMKTCKDIQHELKMSVIEKAENKPLTASIGLAQHKKGMSPTQLFRNADFALYRSKDKKDSIYVFGGFEGH